MIKTEDRKGISTTSSLIVKHLGHISDVTSCFSRAFVRYKTKEGYEKAINCEAEEDRKLDGR